MFTFCFQLKWLSRNALATNTIAFGSRRNEVQSKRRRRTCWIDQAKRFGNLRQQRPNNFVARLENGNETYVEGQLYPSKTSTYVSVLSALRGGSTDAILASYGQDGPKDGITIEQLWIDLDVIFAPVELASDRDKRFAKLKLENFPDISSFVVPIKRRSLNAELSRMNHIVWRFLPHGYPR